MLQRKKEEEEELVLEMVMERKKEEEEELVLEAVMELELRVRVRGGRGREGRERRTLVGLTLWNMCEAFVVCVSVFGLGTMGIYI